MTFVAPTLRTAVDIPPAALHPLDTHPTAPLNPPTLTPYVPPVTPTAPTAPTVPPSDPNDPTHTLLGLIASQFAGAGIPGPADQPIVDPLLTSQAPPSGTASGSGGAVALVIVAGIAMFLWYRHHESKQRERAA